MVATPPFTGCNIPVNGCNIPGNYCNAPFDGCHNNSQVTFFVFYYFVVVVMITSLIVTVIIDIFQEIVEREYSTLGMAHVRVWMQEWKKKCKFDANGDSYLTVTEFLEFLTLIDQPLGVSRPFFLQCCKLRENKIDRCLTLRIANYLTLRIVNGVNLFVSSGGVGFRIGLTSYTPTSPLQNS